MTNLFAVKVNTKEDSYVFCVADSQASGQGEKTSNVQKLIQRGQNLVMATGSAGIAIDVFGQLSNDDIPADCLAGRVLDVSKDIAKEYDGDFDRITTLFVAGPGAKGPEMYEVELISAVHPREARIRIRRGKAQIRGAYSNGSGRGQVVPAFKRDEEMGYSLPPRSPIEGLLMCYGVGKKADSDMGVNERLQIGVVTGSNGTRMILPPGTQTQTELDYRNAIEPLTGVKSEKVPHERRNNLVNITRTVEQFYHALETMMKRLEYRTIVTNIRHNLHLRGEIDVDEYLAACMERAYAVSQAEPYVTAFTSGGIEKIAAAVELFCDEAKDAAKKAVDLK